MSTTVDDETILEVLRSNDTPRMTTTEVAGKLPVTRSTTRTRLQRLVDDDLLERKTEGNNVVWWLPERADELDAWNADEEAEEAETEEIEETEETEETTDEDAVDTANEAEPEHDDTTVEVEAVDGGESDEVTVTTPDEGTETRTAADRSEDAGKPAASSPTTRPTAELSEDDEGLRALALLAAAVVVLLLVRRLLGGSESDEDGE